MIHRLCPWRSHRPREREYKGVAVFGSFTRYREDFLRNFYNMGREEIRMGELGDDAWGRPVMRTVDLDELQSEGSKRAAKGRRKKAWGTINRWSAKHNWIARAAAWDREVDEFVRERQRDEIARMRVENAAIAKAYSGATERWAGFLKCKIALKTVLILPFSMPV